MNRNVTFRAVLFLLVLSLMPGSFYARQSLIGPRLEHHRVTQEQSSPSSPIPLELDRAVMPRLNATQTHTVTVDLKAGEYAQIIFEWGGIDLEVTVRSPGGSAVFPTSIPVRGSGSLPIALIAESPGIYNLEVRAVDQLNYHANYSVVLQALRPPTSLDTSTFEATKVTLDALSQKEKPLMIERLRQALELWSAIPESKAKAFALQRLGNLYMSSKELSKGEAEYMRALEIHERLKNTRALVYTWRDLGADFRAYESPEKAVEKYKKALPIAQGANDRRAESDLLYSIGFAHAMMAQMQAAISAYEPALAIQQAEKNEFNEARTLNAMAGAYDVLSMKSQALSFYKQAILKFGQFGDRYRQAIATNNIGLIHDDWGDYDTAREHYEFALAELKGLMPAGAKPESACAFGVPGRIRNVCGVIAMVSDNLGELSNTLGDPNAALIRFRESLAIKEQLNQPQAIGSTLSRICYSHLLLGKPQEALDYCNRALPLNEQVKDLRTTASTLTFLGMAYAALSNITGDRADQWDHSISHFSRAQQIWRDVGDPDSQAITLYLWASSERDRGDYDSAGKHIGPALEVIESSRARLKSRQLLTHYFAGKQDYYELKIDIDMLRAKKTSSSEHVKREDVKREDVKT